MGKSGGDEYQANDADEIVGELFSGKMSVEGAIERLRTRLLDLSARNRLLNYRHPKGRCIQIVDNPHLTLVFERLFVDGKGVPFKYVREPSPDSYEGKRPEARAHAPRIGISVEFEFSPISSDTNGRRLSGLQTLLYPADLERQLRKISGEAKTAVEETGTNMLFLVFGFLEFYDSDDSEKPLLSPLLSLPVALSRGLIDEETRTYQYTVQHNGEDLAENQTLREKLRRDFMLSLPEFGEEDQPEAYFARIEKTIKNKRRWKVRRQITLGMLSFGKLAIWADLDTKKNPGLVDHALIKSVFSGSAGGGGLYAEDYRIDERPEALQPLIYDADSSQHSAIIDVLSGKNLVVNGPPGTGKSQTITNVIAAALANGKKVLFVSEKLAALEVVRHRLNQAGLGHFCLELHSHNTQKKRFLEDIQARIDQRFPAPAQYQAKLTTLSRQKSILARYAELMGSRIGNALGMTVNEIFWAAERRRQELGDLSAEVNAVRFPDASSWTHDDIESRKARLDGLAELYEVIGRFNVSHPWWGFRPNQLVPSDDAAIGRLAHEASEAAKLAHQATREAMARFQLGEEPDVQRARKIRYALDRIPSPPSEMDAGLLARMFDLALDPRGQHSAQLLARIATDVMKARHLFDKVSRTLVDGRRLAQESVDRARRVVEEYRLMPAFVESDIRTALQMVSKLKCAVSTFDMAASVAAAPYNPASKPLLETFLAAFSEPSLNRLGQHPAQVVAARAEAITNTAHDLTQVAELVGKVAIRHGLSFDSSPDAIVQLADPDGLRGLTPGQRVDRDVVVEASRLAAHPLGGEPLSQLIQIKANLEAEVSACSEALMRCRSVAEQLGLSFDSTQEAVEEIATLADVAVAAPGDLLEYRRASFGQSRASELNQKVRSALASEKADKDSFTALFYLDTMPGVGEIKAAVQALRQKDGFAALFDGDWRKGRKLHRDLSREKRKLSARQRAEELAGLLRWIEAKEAFVADVELKEYFGSLFRGLETEPDKIEKLLGWYQVGRNALLRCSGLVDRVNLTVLPAERLLEVAGQVGSINADVARLRNGGPVARELLARVRVSAVGLGVGQSGGKYWNWHEQLTQLRLVANDLGMVINFFSERAEPNLSPVEAVRLMAAREDLDNVSAELEGLQRAQSLLAEAAGDELQHLIALGNGSWSLALRSVAERAALASALAAQAGTFAAKDRPMSVAATFAQAKLDLYSAYADVASIPVWNRFEGWSGFVYFCREMVTTVETVLDSAVTCCRDGASLQTFFIATDEETEANAILGNLRASEDVARLLGEVFDGADTDLDRLLAIHTWGEAVCAADLPPPVQSPLLSIDAVDALATARRVFEIIDDGCQNARETLEKLGSHGSFSWDEWQKQARSTPGHDLPSEISARLGTVENDLGAVLPWSKYISLRQNVRQDSLAEFVTALETGRLPAAALGSAFELAVYQEIGRSIYRMFPELSEFDGNAHENTRRDYRTLDAEIVSLTGKDFASQIARKTRIPEGQRGTTVGDFTEMHLLRREINKQRRHIPIRQLVRRAGRALQELKPCFMMGPLSVAQYLEQGALSFDLVVMDEASQLRPEEALGAIARGSQLVVVGDPKQLPPTNFFDRMLDSADAEEEDDTPAAVAGMESILDICQQLFTPVRSLRWHYRSQHESLIAFSNHHFYKNLVVFPSPYAKNPGLGVKYRYIRNGFYKDRQNLPEAQRVADAVLEHMIKSPDESLGVVTLNQTQRELIEELLEKKLKTFREGTDFLGRWEAEGWPFFVKNLENVQGDERDVIFISTTFGKAPGTNKPRQQFGPISRADGWRRLNVLFTRSKRRIELFTSMVPEDIVTDERSPLGTKALRDYLDFAKRGVLVTTDEGEREPGSDFEISVANVISALGYEVKPQLGVAGFFIDMAVRNPDRPGEFLAGIECDGATYHSGFSVRDRDRIRQDILESLGWRGRIHRIWSTDWFYDPRREIERLQRFLEERRRLSSAEMAVEVEEDTYGDDEDRGLASGEIDGLSAVMSAAVVASEDVYVEVGDRVTYCLLDEPAERHSILIVDSESNAKMGIVNEYTPVAQALLGLSTGETGTLTVAGQKSRELRVLRIHRQEELED